MPVLETLEQVPDVAANDDAECVQSTLRGDLRGFERIMRRYNQRLYRLAISVLGDPSEAQDVLQESYVRAFYQLEHLADKTNLSAWLARIVRNEAIDRLRSRTARSNLVVLETDLASDDDASIVENIESSEVQSDPESSVAQANVRGLLEDAIRALPQQFRAVFMLREVEGLSINETAEYLGVPPATVKTRDHRARTMLRERLNRRIDAATKDAFAFLGGQCDTVVAAVLAWIQH
jgi:RNA polymerase sigma-70 factor (ECF subfamily)